MYTSYGNLEAGSKYRSCPHKVNNMATKEARSSKRMPSPVTEFFCPLHPADNVTKFCTHHKLILCEKCLINHKTCKSIVGYDKAPIGARKSFVLGNLKTRLNGLLQKDISDLQHAKRSSESLQKDKGNALIDVAKTRQLINKRSDFLEKALKDDLITKSDVCRSFNDEFVSKVQSNQATVQSWLDFIVSLEEEVSDTEMVTVMYVLHRKITQLESRKAELPKLQTIKHGRNNDLEKFKHDFDDLFGYVSLVNYSDPKHGNDVQKVQQQSLKPIASIKMKPVLRHSFKTSKLRADLTVKRGCFLPNHKILLASANEPYLFVTTLDGSNTFTVKMEHNPRDVDLIDNRRAIIALGDQGYQILDLETLTLSERTVPTGHKGFYSISCCGEQILVKSDDNRVTLTDVRGNIRRQFMTENKYFIYQSDDGESFFYVKDFGDDSVHKMSTDGGADDKPFFSHPDLERPGGIAVDRRGDVYVAGGWSHNIFRISQDGKDHDIVLNAKDGIRRPWDLCYHGDTNQLLIINKAWSSIDIYDL